MNNLNPSWPPPYTIKVSQKSRRMTLRISAHKGLEIIVPKRTNIKTAMDFLNLKYNWVQKHRHLLYEESTPIYLPDDINLATIGERWNIRYGQKSLTKHYLSSEITQTLLVKNSKTTTSATLIKEWLRKKAKKHLPLLLSHYSQTYQLPYQGCSVRFQNARWGSCSKDGNISLNCKLLLLPTEITKYILIHELIHTIHLDHSVQFWQAVEQILPHQQALRTQLQQIEQQLPRWLHFD
jgi:predicted metal-dependent hydrolase